MKSKLTNILTYIIPITLNIGLGFLLNNLFSKNDSSNFIMFFCGFTILSTLVVYIISQKINFKLDLFSYKFDKPIHVILNNIFIANILSVPIAMFIAVFL